MTLASNGQSGVQDVSGLQLSMVEVTNLMDAMVHMIQELRSMMNTDPQGRLRVAAETIGGGQTIGTVSTVTSMTTAVDINRLNGLGVAAFSTNPVLIPWQIMNEGASFLRSQIVTN